MNSLFLQVSLKQGISTVTVCVRNIPLIDMMECRAFKIIGGLLPVLLDTELRPKVYRIIVTSLVKNRQCKIVQLYISRFF